MIRTLRTSLAALSLLFSTIGQAGIYEVDDTAIAEGPELEVQLFTRSDGAAREWLLPGIGLNGRFSERLEWSLASGHALQQHNGRDRHAADDIALGLKWLFHDRGEDGGISLALHPELSLPTSNRARGISDGAFGLALPLRLSATRGQHRITGLIGLERRIGRDSDQVEVGLLNEYLVSETLSFGLEFIAAAPRHEPGAREWRGNLGFIRQLGPRFELQMRAGRDLDGPRRERTRELGLMLVRHLH